MPRSLAAHTQSLREAFDRRFAAPASYVAEAPVNLLGLRVGGETFALPLDALSGLHALRRLVPLPGCDGALLGLTGVRGRLVPVFSLASLLNRPPEPAVSWLVLVGQDEPVALAFSELEGHFQLPRELLIRAHAERSPGAPSMLLPDGSARQLIDLAALIVA